MRMRVALLTTGSAYDVRTWSGSAYHIRQELSRRFEVVAVEKPLLDKAVLFARKVFNKVGIDIFRERLVAQLYDRLLSAELKRLRPDVIVSVASSHKIACLRAPMPIIHISDATFAAMRDYYPRNFRSLRPRSTASGHSLEQLVLRNSKVALLSSDWAAESAIRDYGIAPDKVVVAPFGANVDVKVAPSGKASTYLDTINLLFIGVDWQRKGGPIAFDTMNAIRAAGIACKLHVVGCIPPQTVAEDPDVVRHGFLNKHNPPHREVLDRLFQMASFLIVPSRQEAYGLVFAEAAAYGLPVLATRTGGIPTIVSDGETGFLFALDAEAERYGKRVLEMRQDPAGYMKMRQAARDRYVAHLTWEAWGDKISEVIAQLTASGVRRDG